MRRARETLEQLEAELQEYFSGRRRRFDVPVDLVGISDFARKVLAALARVPYGTTTSYGELARSIGAPGAARAVGRACARNPVPILIPCHRVVRADGELGGYAWGTQAKRLLLQIERGAPEEQG